jgi:hypothetical protein
VSRDLGPDREPERDQEPEPGGRVRTTSAGALAGFASTGLVLGWLLRPVSIAMSDVAPTVGWLPAGALLFVAAVVGWVALSTHRSFQRRHERIEPHRAVNRLVLAKSCALAGALVAGGYFGYALSYLGIVDSDLAEQRVLHSLAAGIASVLLVVASLLLERACRVPGAKNTRLP